MAFLLEGIFFKYNLLTLPFFAEEGGIQPFALYNMEILREMNRNRRQQKRRDRENNRTIKSFQAGICSICA